MRKIGWTALAVGLATTVTTSAQADVSEIYGKWVPTTDQCMYGGSVSSALFTIMPGKVQYFENTCQMVGAPQPDGTVYSVTVSCPAVEGGPDIITTTYERFGDRLFIRAVDGFTIETKSCP